MSTSHGRRRPRATAPRHARRSEPALALALSLAGIAVAVFGVVVSCHRPDPPPLRLGPPPEVVVTVSPPVVTSPLGAPAPR